MSQTSDDSQSSRIGSTPDFEPLITESHLSTTETNVGTPESSGDMSPMSGDASQMSDDSQAARTDTGIVAEWQQPQKLPEDLREHLAKVGLEGFDGVPQSQLQEVLKVAGPNLTIQDPITGLEITLDIQAMAASEEPSVVYLNYRVTEETDDDFQRKLEQGWRLD